ncbi:aconitase [Bradyrhizobium canariense]|uniref:Aconitase n=2 Tax=Bradyrhizobium canariense TaxID=255045 RepID=A0A1X3HFH5_9BRAD|nr:aconitase family protein [Bradyrhizobium canariense]OSI81005.1 aconitase [Bradyrhizobium canariense]OSI82592.1 aconitase [Bradyrhizobium canariense]OSJ17559.1 aconitase [Bradyrhizobium canariense]OSJ19449.1 aconitase [Bradyrhizobium canariense]
MPNRQKASEDNSKTMTEKLLARASGRNAVSVGDVLTAKIDVVSIPDSVVDDWLIDNNLKAWDPKRVVFSFDHLPPRATGANPKWWRDVEQSREFAQKIGVPRENIYDIGRHGLSHQVPAEEGWVLPGTFYLSSDTQGATMGALNCFAMPGIFSTFPALATGEMWMVVPEAVRIHLTGEMPKGILGKDIYFRLLQDLRGRADSRVLEFGGPGLKSLPIDVRMGVANGSNHIGAITSVFEPDQRLLDYVKPRAREPFKPVTPDRNAKYVDSYEYDLSTFEPLVSGPGDISRIQPLSQVRGTKIHAAYIGSCSGGRMEDLKLAAEVLDGRKISPDVRLVVTPISSNVQRDATEKGVLRTLLRAGAAVTSPGCGACHFGNDTPLRLGDGETCITASVENYAGRMGSIKANIYAANAAIVAASALTGEITDPRGYFK